MLLIAAGIAIALASPSLSYAATPQQAALGAVYPHTDKTAVLRTNVAGRYAAVLIRDAMQEGAPINAPILVERFSFGWQPLEVLNFRCRLLTHAISPRDRQRLMAGMPPPLPEAVGRPCREDDTDVGPPAQVEAVRRMMEGRLIPSVTVAGGFALGNWYGGGGGQALFALRGGRWQRITSGGGALGVAEMRRYHVPQSAWCTLRIYDAPCRV